MTKSRIDWTEYTWNPVTGCTPVSEACDHCYARRMSERFYGAGSFNVQVHEDRLADPEPLRTRKARVYFVSSMGDLFHKDVPDEAIRRVFGVMEAAADRGHTFILCTKRPERMVEFAVPSDHIWYGVTAETQERFDARLGVLSTLPTGCNLWISAEPLFGALDVSRYLDRLGWVVAGGESGMDARPTNPEWFFSLRDQCSGAGVPFFFKSWGEWAPVQGMMIRTSTKDRFLEGAIWNQTPFMLHKTLTSGTGSTRVAKLMDRSVRSEVSLGGGPRC
jgi:protein gp37